MSPITFILAFILYTLSFLSSTLPLAAQTPPPVRLALISETDAAAPAVDVLTAQFSGNPQVQLLERDQIAKVYREQGLSAANTDYVKLGQLLGADGLLLLQTVTEGTNQVLNTRLIAVKPGVVLVAERYDWPLPDPSGWTAIFARHLAEFLPKLTVLNQDAIPLSVVNLRSAVTSAEAAETERQLKLLTIQRLSREPQLFVLERQRMQLLGEEKELKSDDSPFWNGSYLLEGVVDQNGYSQDTITLNARLTPPQGGAPVTMEISGARTNLADVANQLAAKVDAALKVSAAAKPWNAADEAAQYCAEAKWALRWGEYSEAQAAAESAWALGKHDEECATVRVRAYMLDIIMGGFTTMPGDLASLQAVPNFAWSYVAPDTNNLDRALTALEIYNDFSRTLPPEKLIPDSVWYDLGIDDLTVASDVLNHFHFVHSSQQQSAEKLARLRSQARAAADWIAGVPAVREFIRVDTQPDYDIPPMNVHVIQDMLYFEVKWGRFWQDKPEDCVSFYCKLMSNPAFLRAHGQFWCKDAANQRLTAWSDEDRSRIPAVWQDFIRELNNSTNRLLQIEAAAATMTQAQIQQRDAEGWQTLRWTENDDNFEKEKQYLADWGYGHHDAGQFNPAEFQATFQFRDFSAAQADQIKQKLEVFNIFFNSKARTASGGDKATFLNALALAASVQSDVNRALQAEADQENLAAFESQVEFLKANKPYNMQTFGSLFTIGFRDYSPTQALEIRPLLAAYKTNLTGVWAANGQIMVGQVEAVVNRILNPPAPKTNATVVLANHPPATNRPPGQVVPARVAAPVAPQPAEPVTNILAVQDYLKMPLDRMEMPYIHDLYISSHRWSDGKLLLDLRYDGQPNKGALYEFPMFAIAIFDPVTGGWQMISYPRDINYPDDVRSINAALGSSVVLRQNNLFLSFTEKIRKYDLQTGEWQTLDFPGQARSLLFTVDGHVYAANGETIQEITDNGKGTRLLASIRRRPVASALDSLDSLGAPFLFLRTNHILAAKVVDSIYTWEHDGWQKAMPLSPPPPDQQPIEGLEEGFLYRTESPLYADVWVWENGRPAPELWLHDNLKTVGQAVGGNVNYLRPSGSNPGGFTEIVNGLKVGTRHNDLFTPRNQAPLHDYLAGTVATFYKSKLFFLVDHSEQTNNAGSWTLVAKDGYNVRLFCVSSALGPPVEVPLNLDLSQEQPSWGYPPLLPRRQELINPFTWMRFVGDNLYIGQDYTLGVWVIPISKIEAAIDAQKQILLVKTRQEEEAKHQLQAQILAKYDLNHNGVIDPDEKEAALDDPDFISWELDNIDTNHNGWLDASELAWFDANQNKVLDPKEQAGIEIAQHLLAERLFKQFDRNNESQLDRSEVNDLLHAAGIQSAPGLRPAGMNPGMNLGMNGAPVKLADLETFLKQQTRRGLRGRGTPSAALLNRLNNGTGQPVDARQVFKAEVESYWQNPGGATNRTPAGSIQPRPATP